MKSARDFAQLWLGNWYGHYGTAPCPVCQPERRKGQNALTVADGQNGGLLLHCKKNDCAFLDILAAVGLRTGDYTPPDAATVAERQREAKTKTEKRASKAKRLWQEARHIAGTLAEIYLRARHNLQPAPGASLSSGSVARADCPQLSGNGGSGARGGLACGASHLPARRWHGESRNRP